MVEKKEFAAAVFDLEHETYIVYVASLSSTPLASLESTPLDVHPFQRPQISGLIAKKSPTKVPAEYSDFTDVLSLDLTFKLPKYSGINNHAIKLIKGCQQPPYGPIYSLKPVELETLKAYIETNLANGFIRPCKSPTRAPILFDQKLDGFLRFSIEYQGLNNLTIKNRYLLPLIRVLLDKLGRAKRFTQLNLTSTYH